MVINRNKKSLQGVVINNSLNKTITIIVTRIIKHIKYGKYITKNKKYHAHDQFNKCNIGDRVSIIESKPYSKLKKWCLQKIFSKLK